LPRAIRRKTERPRSQQTAGNPRHRYCPSSLSSLHLHCIFPSCHSVICLFLSFIIHHFSTYFPYLCLLYSSLTYNHGSHHCHQVCPAEAIHCIRFLAYVRIPHFHDAYLQRRSLKLMPSRLPGSGIAKTILRSTAQHANRFSWVLVDAEHGLITDRDYYEGCPHYGFSTWCDVM